MLSFDKKYRRLLHAELDELLDVSETVRTGTSEFQDAKALAERTARKWAMYSLLVTAIDIPHGKDRVIERLNREIEMYRRMIEIRQESTEKHEHDIACIEDYKRTIVLIENVITKLDS